MAKLDGASTTSGGVLNGDIGTALTTAHIALGVGWGDAAATVTVTAGSNSQRGQFTILTAGANQAQATATIVLTFPDPYTGVPFCIQKYATNDNSLTAHTGLAHSFTTSNGVTTACTFTHSVLPVTAKTYTINYAFAK